MANFVAHDGDDKYHDPLVRRLLGHWRSNKYRNECFYLLVMSLLVNASSGVVEWCVHTKKEVAAPIPYKLNAKMRSLANFLPENLAVVMRIY